MTTTRTTLILSDVQHPYHYPKLLKKFIKIARDIQPDRILSIGDAIDLPTVSRWSKGTAEEYSPILQEHIAGFRAEVLVPLREAAPKAAITWLEGNHDLRIQDYLKKYGPALRSLEALSMQSLFGLRELDIEYVKGPLHVATNTVAIHGHEPGAYAATPNAWDLKLLKRYGTDNVVFGHTHQPFITTSAHGHSGKVRPRWIMNVGSIMDPNHAHYMKDGAVSWTPSFALIRDIPGKIALPELVIANDGRFLFEGEWV